MCDGSTPNGFEAILRRLGAAGKILAVTHARPDGDAIGSLVALARSARAAGKECQICVPDSVPDKYRFILGEGQLVPGEQFDALAGAADLVVTLDTCAFGQLDGLGEGLRRYRDKIVVIDHHATGDEIGSDRWVDTSAAATGVMVGELLAALGWPVDLATAEALAVAITADTGWFRFANTDARVLRATAKLIDAGVQLGALYERLYLSGELSRVRLMQRMLASLKLHLDERLAVMTLERADFEQAGAKEDQSENLVNEALRIGSVQAAVLLIETPDGTRVSLRSRGHVDVAALAATLGGGGHPRAAGLRSELPVAELADKLICAIAEVMDAKGES